MAEEKGKKVKGHKVLNQDEIDSHVRKYAHAIEIDRIESDVGIKSSDKYGPWNYKDIRKVWIHYTVIHNDAKYPNKIRLDNLRQRGFQKTVSSYHYTYYSWLIQLYHSLFVCNILGKMLPKKKS